MVGTAAPFSPKPLDNQADPDPNPLLKGGIKPYSPELMLRQRKLLFSRRKLPSKVGEMVHGEASSPAEAW